jgi:hypothetical protein
MSSTVRNPVRGGDWLGRWHVALEPRSEDWRHDGQVPAIRDGASAQRDPDAWHAFARHDAASGVLRRDLLTAVGATLMPVLLGAGAWRLTLADAGRRAPADRERL